MRITHLTAADRDRVSAAVTEAETGTDGEIVTVVAQHSDKYHDVALHYAIAAMLLTVALAALNPTGLEDKLAWFSNGWTAETDSRANLFALMIIEAIVFLAARYGLAWMPLRLALTPKGTRSRRVRRRAVDTFRVGTERRTDARVGVLLYLSLDERMAEIVADEGLHGKVAPEIWGDAMAALVEKVRDGKPGEGMAAAVAQIGTILAEHCPKTDADVNELPDRLIEL
ncbi:TPM domain-containing protein [soil metagenome]